jgi:hypothetical protein
MSITTPSIVLVLLAAAGQAGPYTPESAPSELKPAIQKADRAFARLRDALIARLTDELSKGDAQTALSACHDVAPDIAREVRRTEGLALGRTSHRLRNPQNQPPAWAADHVARAAGKSAAEAQPLVVDLGERVGVMRPIVTMGLCVNCHGPEEQIAPDVQETLTALYPSDKATGFSEGDLRGWMWAEVPR